MGTRVWQARICALASLLFVLASFSAFLYAGMQDADDKNIEKATGNNILIDLRNGISSSLKVEPKKQYLVYLKGANLSESERAVLIGRYYEYKTGTYTKYFVLNDLLKEEDTPVFTLYTEIESYGYYSIRFFKVTEEIKDKWDSLLQGLDKGDSESSTVIPTCFASTRLYLEGVKPPEIVQFDYGWSMLFNSKESKINGPEHFFVLNAYPGAWLMSYKKAAKDVFLSKISISFGLGLSKNEEGNKSWFLGVTIPVVYDFSGVIGVSWLSGKTGSSRISFGVKIGPELFLKAIEAMKIMKVPEF